MGLSFVTPWAGLFALTVVAPLAVFALRRRRLGAVRRALGLAEPDLRTDLSLVLALAAVPFVTGAAATQPVVETERTALERMDAQVFVVLDTSRSMLAAPKPGAETRFERARAIVLNLPEELPEVPIGVATVTDRVLPNLFPTTDGRVYVATLEKAVAVDRPPAGAFYLTAATNLNGLADVPEKNYFLPTARRRALVVLTDGETQPLGSELARAFLRRPRIETIFVHVWGADERIYETGVAEGGYQPEPRSSALLDRAAALVGGRVFQENDAAGVVGAVRAAIGEGETVSREHEAGRFALMPYVTLAALLPLGFLLLRRNVWWHRPLPRLGGPQPDPRPDPVVPLVEAARTS